MMQSAPLNCRGAAATPPATPPSSRNSKGSTVSRLQVLRPGAVRRYAMLVSNEVNCAKASLQNVGTYRTITPTCTSLSRNNVQRTPSLMRMKSTDRCSSASTPSSVRKATLLPHPSSSRIAASSECWSATAKKTQQQQQLISSAERRSRPVPSKTATTTNPIAVDKATSRPSRIPRPASAKIKRPDVVVASSPDLSTKNTSSSSSLSSGSRILPPGSIVKATIKLAKNNLKNSALNTSSSFPSLTAKAVRRPIPSEIKKTTNKPSSAKSVPLMVTKAPSRMNNNNNKTLLKQPTTPVEKKTKKEGELECSRLRNKVSSNALGQRLKKSSNPPLLPPPSSLPVKVQVLIEKKSPVQVEVTNSESALIMDPPPEEEKKRSCEMLTLLECEHQSIRGDDASARNSLLLSSQPSELDELTRIERDIDLLLLRNSSSEKEEEEKVAQQRSLSLPKSFLADRYGIVDSKAALPSVRFPWRKAEGPTDRNSQPDSTPSDKKEPSVSLPPNGSAMTCSDDATGSATCSAQRRIPGSISRTDRRLKTSSSPIILPADVNGEKVNRSHSAWDLARPWSLAEEPSDAGSPSGLMMMLMMADGNGGSGAGSTTTVSITNSSSCGPSSYSSISTHPATAPTSSSPTPTAGSSSTLRKFRKSFSLRLARKSSQEESHDDGTQQDSSSPEQVHQSPKFRFGPLVWRSSRERTHKKNGSGDKAARNAKCNSGDSGVQMETTHLADDGSARRTQSDLGGEAVIAAALKESWNKDTEEEVDTENDYGNDQVDCRGHYPVSRSRKLTRHSAKAHLRRSSSQPAVVALAAGSCNNSNHPSDEDAGLCLSEDDNLSDNDHIRQESEASSMHYSAATQGVLAIALWDHQAVEPEELSLRAGDVVHVLDLSDPDWWWAAASSKRQPAFGWLPASYVQLCEPPFNRTLREQLQNSSYSLKPTTNNSLNARRMSSVVLGPAAALSTHSVRANVINELITAERDYVKLLSDLVDGYLIPMRNRPDLFSQQRIQSIFGNLEDLYQFQKNFLVDLELSLNWNCLEDSVVGGCFIQHIQEFTIYATYCNNQDRAAAEMQLLCEDIRYLRFFEACRLLRRMIRLPLEAFLLSPVQKICKYPLQLAELLKHTDDQHPDRRLVAHALDSMRSVAYLVNESKRRAEMHQFLVQWQSCVDHWMGSNITEQNSLLIRQGELFKISSSGWTRDVTLFLFDKELVICKKELIKRSSLVYKDRLRVDDVEVLPEPLSAVEAGRPNAFQLRSRSRAKCYLLAARSAQDKHQWIMAIEQLQQRRSGDHCWISSVIPAVTTMTLGRHKIGTNKRNSKVKPNPALTLTLEEAHLTLEGRDPATIKNMKKS